MGNCSSHGFGSAKLVLQDGQLEEFPDPIRVSELAKRSPGCFVCNSDEMDFDGFVSAMDGDEALIPGQLYFELPLSFLKRRLQPEDMASMAVKASVALSSRSHHHHHHQCGCYYRSPKRVFSHEDPIMFLQEESVRVRSRTRKGCGGGDPTTVRAEYSDLRFVRGRRPAAWKAGNVKATKFTSTLSAILEMEE